MKYFLCVFLFLCSFYTLKADDKNMESNDDLQDDSLMESVKYDKNYASGNYVMLTINSTTYQRNDYNGTNIQGAPMGYGLRYGNISYMTDYLAIRGFVGVDMLNDKLGRYAMAREINQGFATLISAGLDIIYDINLDSKYKYCLGFYFGFGAGGYLYSDIFFKQGENKRKIIYTGGMVMQMGFSMLFYRKHRVEFGVRVLPNQSLSLNVNNFVSDYESYIGYSYKF